MKNIILSLAFLLAANGICSSGGSIGGGVNCASGTNGQVYTTNGATCSFSTVSGTGTVTSVAASVPNFLSIAGSPITGAGTLAITLATQTTNKVFAAPNGSTAAPSFRALVGADIPDLSATYMPLAGGTMSGNLNLGNLTASTALATDGSKNVVSSSTTATELGYVHNVTSAIQTQLDAKLPTAGTGLVEVFTGMMEAPTDKTYVLDQSAAYAYTINTIKIITVSGTTTAAVKINGTNVTGISAVSVSSSVATGTASAANSVSIGDKVTLVLSSSSSPVDLTYTLKYTR